MRVFRIAHQRFVDDLSGEGARRNGGRWTPPGWHAIYASEHPALAAWEKLVHMRLNLDTTPLNYELAALDVPDNNRQRIPHVPDDPQSVGKTWLQQRETLVLEIPSMVVPYSWNAIINPQHPAMSEVVLQRLGTFVFDPRARQST